MSHEPFSTASVVRALHGNAAHLAEVCGRIVSLNTRLEWPAPDSPEGREALRQREPLERAYREFLGAWLAKEASPQDLRILAKWMDATNKGGPVEELLLGIHLATCGKAVEGKSLDDAAKALNPDNLREVLREMPRAELKEQIEASRMGRHTPTAIQHRLGRDFGATRDGLGRPPNPK